MYYIYFVIYFDDQFPNSDFPPSTFLVFSCHFWESSSYLSLSLSLSLSLLSLFFSLCLSYPSLSFSILPLSLFLAPTPLSLFLFLSYPSLSLSLSLLSLFSLSSFSLLKQNSDTEPSTLIIDHSFAREFFRLIG
jgi:hypothetical protein